MTVPSYLPPHPPPSPPSCSLLSCPASPSAGGMDRGGEGAVSVGGRVNVTRGRVGKRWRPPATSDGAGNPLDNAQADPAGDNACASSSLRTFRVCFFAPIQCHPTTTPLYSSSTPSCNELLTLIAALSPFAFFLRASCLFVTLNPAFSRRAVTTRLNEQSR